MRFGSLVASLIVCLPLLTGCTRQVAEIFRGKAETENEKGDYRAAIADCNHAELLDRTLVGVHGLRGFARFKLNDSDGAVRDFEAEIKLNPRYSGGHYGRGLVERQRQQYDLALADFNEAIRLNPKAAESYSQRGAVKQSKGDLKGAIEDYNRSLTLSPKDAETMRARTFAEYSLGEYQTALADVNRAIALDPQNTVAYVARGWINYLERHVPKAVEDYNKALQIDPKLLAAYVDRSIARSENGDYEGAMADASQVIAEQPKAPENYLQRAIIRYCHAESDGAAEDCFRAIQLDPNLGSSPKYGPFLLWLASTESQNPASGGPRLSDHIDVVAAATLKDWNSKVAAFLLDQISEADFLSAAASPDSDTNRTQHCQAWYYAGMRRWRDGDKIVAIDDFEKSITTGKDTLFEYMLSRHQLAELDRSEKKSDDFRSGFRPSLKIESSDH